jgi:hypothetical protein
VARRAAVVAKSPFLLTMARVDQLLGAVDGSAKLEVIRYAA